jgi:uncharacterized protein YkwD
MKPLALSFVIFATCLTVSFAKTIAPESETVSSNAIIREINLAREHPALYATFIEALCSSYNQKFLVLPGGTRIPTHEGLRAVNDAIRFLRSAQPEAPLVLSAGMSRAAADHCADQIGGALGHQGSDRSDPGSRISRYGIWTGAWAENISYGKTSARDIILALIIDDGIAGRKHRKNIFNPKFNFAGAAYGPHARYRSVCSIDFAGAYIERGREVANQVVTRNSF